MRRPNLLLVIAVTLAVSAISGCGGSSGGGTPVTPLSIATTSLANGTAGTAYTAVLSASGGTAPYSWSLSAGHLPAGLTLSGNSGSISGTPSAPVANTALTFTVSDSGSPVQSKSVSLTLTIAPAPLAITTASLPSGTVGVVYSTTLAASGGTTPFTWSLTSGTLPANLSLNPGTGAITGTPSAAVTSTALTFKVADSGSPVQTKTVNLTLTVVPAPLVITTTSLPSGTVGVAYSATLVATGGTTPFTWSLTSGTLPTGLSLNPSTGAITGNPSLPATNLALTFKLSDAGVPAQTTSVNLTLTIAPGPLVITTSSLPGGVVASPYSTTLATTGGTAPFTWSLTSGALPANLSLNPGTGAISGTPSAPVTSTALTFKVTDSGSPVQTNSVNLTLTIIPASLVITSTSLPSGTVGVAYSVTLAATGGTTPFTWSLTAGILPAGLSLNPASGAITGTPSAAVANAALTFKVVDSGSAVQSQSVSLTLTIAAPPLVITTSSLPGGTVGLAYSSTLVAAGGTTPFAWSLTSGTLPTGLSLIPATGAITGTPSVSATNTPLTFTLTDSSNPVQTQKVNLTLSIFSLLVLPLRAGLVINQAFPVTATLNDSAGVTWSATGSGCSGTSCGVFSSTTSKSGVPVTYTAPAVAGVYTIKATGVTNTAETFSSTVAVTDLAGVTTYHNDQYRDGANTQEYALTPSTVTTSTFGKLASCPVDGAIYAQPLWVPNLTIGSVVRNVVFVATMHNSIYAFDADANGACAPLWHANLLAPAYGGTANEVPYRVGGDISPEAGVTGTPVIDLTTNTLYAVAVSTIIYKTTAFQRLHAIDLLTGNEKFGGPTLITATYPGTGDGGSTTTFLPYQENQRPGLALSNGVVYISWASHGDGTPFYGWIIGYKASDLSQVYVLNVAPNAGEAGIWMSGGAPAVDSSNKIYVLTANGGFDATNASGPTNDYGDSYLELTSDLKVSQYFTPSDQLADENSDADFGSGGPTLIDIPVNGKNPTHLAIGGGKDSTFYLLNRDDMGALGNANAWQNFSLGASIFATGAYWNYNFYVAGINSQLAMFTLNPATAKMNTPASSMSKAIYGFPGASPSVTSTPNYAHGIVWALDNTNYCTADSPACGPTVLRAYSASDLSNEIWNSSQSNGDAAGFAVKFTVPTIANGKAYVGTRGNNTGDQDPTTSTPGELDIYGLLPN